ncbi:hypothetical protein RM780_09710 [Streptomyces sp. DSM 44917]|uniref:Uncharacterized protein n=1 Tax=Streptomyces boetiae TaxID=3075541 RepID=A0ABU2L7P9_9ACTN|nr:hypothetical protein [Streptomyces sp. DSM 44917]MDT0307238.1 hypothetical protein [Streptomyces sp. DSM 44917]
MAKKVGRRGWFFLDCGCVAYMVADWRLHTQTPTTVECPESKRLHDAYAKAVREGGIGDGLPQLRAINEHYGIPEEITAAFEARFADRPPSRPRTLVDAIGTQTGWYDLRCGCRVFVKYPGCYVHVVDAVKSCEELDRLQRSYRAKVHGALPIPAGAWADFIAMYRHVGAPAEAIADLESASGVRPAAGKGR